MEELTDLLEFQELMNEKRHKEVVSIMSNMLNAIPKNLPDNKDDMNRLYKLIESMKSIDDSVPRAVQAIGEAIVQKIESVLEPKERPIKRLDIIRDSNELMKSVNIIRE